MDKKKLILIDGYSFFFRAYHALKNIKRRSDGMALNGVYGFTKMLMNIIIDLKSTHIAVVFDTGNKTFRNDIFNEYKANRPPVPDDMIPQFPIIREVVNVLNIKSVEKDGYEADDVIATLSKKAEKDGYEVWIISSDKDLMQLVNENIFLYETKENKKIGIKEVKEKWGVEPDKLLDVLSLMGDKADNVPGVPSIGEKGAIELVNKFGNIDNIIENIDKIKQEKKKDAIKNNIDKLILSRKLIKLCDDIKLDIKIEDFLFKSFNPVKLKDFLYKMEFNSIAREIEKYFDTDKNFIKNDKYKKITDEETLKNFYKDLIEKNNSVIIDINSSRNNNFESIDTICFYDINKDLVFYICLNDCSNLIFDNSIRINNILDIIKNLLEDEKILKITYNAKNLTKILKQYNIKFKNYDDIGTMSYLLDNGKHENNLSDIISYYLYNNIEIKINDIEKNNSLIRDYENGKNIEGDIFMFSCFKTEMIKILYKLLKERILKNKEILDLYNNIEKPLIEILANMEFLGVKVDISSLKKLSDYFLNELNKIEKKIYEISNIEFNINSPKQLSDILFNKMCLPKLTKPSKLGNYSTDVETLENLYNMGFEIAGKILEYRHYTKLKNTYTDTLQKLVDNNSRIHTTYSNISVITGRLSSNNPNLQNIPIRTEDGEKIRKTFISKEGYSFIGVDYSQIELRILAEYANVKRLKENFENDLDIHIETAKSVFNTENITPEMRRMAKAINFSIIYGTTSFGLAKRLDKTNNEAKEYIEKYFTLYPEIKKYMEEIKDFVKKNGYIKTMFNRICYIDINGPKKSFLERLAINAPIQGTGADIIKIAMINVNNAIKNYDANIILQIHDELLIEVKEEQIEEIKEIVKKEMENIKFNIKLPVDIKIGKNWGDVH